MRRRRGRTRRMRSGRGGGGVIPAFEMSGTSCSTIVCTTKVKSST